LLYSSWKRRPTPKSSFLADVYFTAHSLRLCFFLPSERLANLSVDLGKPKAFLKLEKLLYASFFRNFLYNMALDFLQQQKGEKQRNFSTKVFGPTFFPLE
jgi:hypothetical protein